MPLLPPALLNKFLLKRGNEFSIATCLVINRTVILMCNAVTHHQVGVEKALHFVDDGTFVFLIILTPEVIAIPEIFSCYYYKATVRDKLIMKNLVVTLIGQERGFLFFL